MIVLDASAVIEMLLNTREGRVIAKRVLGEDSLGAPHLLDAEVGQVLRRFTLRRKMSSRRAAQAIDDLLLLPITRYPHAPLVHRAFALRGNLTFYDGLYLALAEAADAPLVTRDRALAAAPGARARVELL